MLTDQQLVHEWVVAAQGGDHSAFKNLVERYEPQVAATVIGMLGEGGEAEDIGQETFIRFYQNLHAFRGEAGVGLARCVAVGRGHHDLFNAQGQRPLPSDLEGGVGVVWAGFFKH